MTTTVSYPVGAPCWIETLQPDLDAAVAFYSEVMGWTFDEAGSSGYRLARLDGQRVAGLAKAPATLDRGAWVTYILVSDIDRILARVIEAAGVVLVGPLKGESDERTALFADPNGAVFGVRQGATPTVSEVVDSPGAWQMSSLHTPDIMAAENFYAKVFGWQIEHVAKSGISLWHLAGSTRRTGDPTLPDDVVAVVTVEADPNTDVPPHWTVNLQVSDADDMAARVVKLGGSLLMPPTDAPGFRSALIVDPNGGVLAISQVIIPRT